MAPFPLGSSLPMHVFSVDDEPEPGQDLSEFLETGSLVDIGLGLPRGVDAANIASLARNKMTLVYAPALHRVLYLVKPGDLTLH
jgi:hypothetical protein